MPRKTEKHPTSIISQAFNTFTRSNRADQCTNHLQKVKLLSTVMPEYDLFKEILILNSTIQKKINIFNASGRELKWTIPMSSNTITNAVSATYQIHYVMLKANSCLKARYKDLWADKMKVEQIKTEGDECIQDQKIFSKVAIKDRTGSIFLK